MRACHQLIWASAVVNNRAGISIISVQALITSGAVGWLGADYPDNHIINPIRRGNKGRAATAVTPCHTPRINNGRRIGRGNLESRKHLAARTESHIGALFRPIGDRCLGDLASGDVCRCYGQADAAKAVAINQIGVAILAQGDHQVGRRCVRYVY